MTILASGCASLSAKSAADLPALEVPPPPPRTVEPADTEPTPPATLPDEPSRRAPVAAPRRSPPTPPPAPRPETREAPKTEPPLPVTPAVDPKPAEPPKTLQTTSAEEEGRENQLIRALLAKASNDLKRIDYQRLDTDARTQYDTAKRFVTQAENALRTKNLVMARSIADKAAALAAQLAGK